MPTSLAAMLALINDNTSGDISAADHRATIQALYDWIPNTQKYLMGRLAGETAHAADDFFTTYSGYTEQTPTGSATWSLGRAGLTVTWNSIGANTMAATLKAVPAAGVPITIETALVAAMKNSDNSGLGLCFTNGTGSGADVTGIGWVMAAAGAPPSLYKFDGILTAYGVTLLHQAVIVLGSPQFLRLVWKSANTFGWSISADGELWTDWNTADISNAMTPTHMGFWVINNTVTTRQTALFHYLRAYEADLSQ